MPSTAPPIDVVIPVYNAPEFTRRCIDSLYRWHGADVGSVHVHDNASEAPTRAMLDGLAHARLHVHHAPRNTGFGDGVNQGFARTKSELVLVLNSDVEARGDFLTPLRAALAADPALAVVTPGGNTFASHDLSRYALRAGCVVTYNLYAYAFLIRRSAFEALGGFDPAFGLGFFEDTDLSRKLVGAGHWLGIQPQAELHHEIHGSFEAIPSFRDFLGNNLQIYLARYPSALRQILVASGASHLDALPPDAVAELTDVLRGGGGVHWLTRAPLERLPAFEVRADPWSLRSARRALRKHRHKAHKRFTEFWLVGDAPSLASFWLSRWARAQGVAVRRISVR